MDKSCKHTKLQWLYAAGLRHRLVGPGPLTSKAEAFRAAIICYPRFMDERIAATPERENGRENNRRNIEQF